MSRKPLILISLITMASLLLAACGDPSNLPAPQQTAVAEAVRDTADFMENGPEMVATQVVGAGIEYVYDAEPNLATLLPPELCPNPQTIVITDEWGYESEMWLCNQHSPEDLLGATSFEADLAIVGVTALSPLPGDEVVAVVSLTAKRVAILIVTAAAAQYVGRGLVQMARHTDPSHNPNFKDSLARTHITAILAMWAGLLAANGNPEDPQVKCGAIKDSSGAAIRIVVHIVKAAFTAVVNPGNPNHPWVTGYGQGTEQFQAGPDKNKMRPGETWDPNFPCPGELPNLQPALP